MKGAHEQNNEKGQVGWLPRRRAVKKDKGELVLDFGEVSEKQKRFLEADSFFVCYGGARGGGKSHVLRLKAVGMCLKYPGIRVLIIRCHYPELEENQIQPILKWVPNEIYSYNGTTHLMSFMNGSIIKFGHYDGDRAENEYQGVQYDVVFIDEATQLSERAFKYLQTIVRGTNGFPKRMYLTCNPGGVGHRWVKRLFIDQKYINDPDDPERSEDPANYTFIFATVDDNKWLLESSPMYKQNLASLPEDLRAAHRYGDWDALSGSYFKNFRRELHTRKPFKIPPNWKIYRAFDYGLDMLAVGWWAVDEDGRTWCFRYFEESGLVIRDAAGRILEHTLPGENVEATFAPPDMWNRQKDTGKTIAAGFLEGGVAILKSDNNRVQGHMLIRDMMSPIPLRDPYVISLYPEGKAPKELPGLMIFDTCEDLIEDLTDIQADEKNPSDCSKEPHDVTHSVDMTRYYCVSYTMTAESQRQVVRMPPDEEEEKIQPYEDFMTGGEPTEDYMAY